MTAPFPITPPKSLDGRSSRELFAYERTVPPGEEVPPAGGPGSIPDVALPISDGNLMTVLLRQPNAVTEYWPRQRPWFDCRAFNQMRVIADVDQAGVFGSEVFAERTATPDDAESWVEPGADAGPITVTIDQSGPVKGLWTTLGSVGDFAWRARARRGDGSATPVLGKVHFQFRQASAPRPPTQNVPSDLPDPIWWSKSGDLMFTDYEGDTPNSGAHGSGVGFWGDKTGNGWFFRRSALGTAPTLDTSETDLRGLASIRFSPETTPKYFRQDYGAVAGRDVVTCFIVKRHVTNLPTAATSGVWHYGRRLTSNDAAHPWVGGEQVWESFGQGFHVLMNVVSWDLDTYPFDAWHVWCVRSDDTAGSEGTMDCFYNGEFVGQRGIMLHGNPNRWPIEPRDEIEPPAAFLGRSYSHQGNLWVTEIIAYGAALTDFQIAQKSDEMLNG